LLVNAGNSRHGWRSCGRELLLAALVIASLVLAKAWLERSEIGQLAFRASYASLQRALFSEENADALPVTLVDISEIQPMATVRAGEVQTVTPRESLSRLLEALVMHEPKAIGVDIDFSSDSNEPLAKDDGTFVHFCYELTQEKPAHGVRPARRGVPIFLGVARQAMERRDPWLKDPRLSELAASISMVLSC